MKMVGKLYGKANGNSQNLYLLNYFKHHWFIVLCCHLKWETVYILMRKKRRQFVEKSIGMDML